MGRIDSMSPVAYWSRRLVQGSELRRAGAVNRTEAKLILDRSGPLAGWPRRPEQAHGPLEGPFTAPALFHRFFLCSVYRDSQEKKWH
jgi:hypothetical protein